MGDLIVIDPMVDPDVLKVAIAVSNPYFYQNYVIRARAVPETNFRSTSKPIPRLVPKPTVQTIRSIMGQIIYDSEIKLNVEKLLKFYPAKTLVYLISHGICILDQEGIAEILREDDRTNPVIQNTDSMKQTPEDLMDVLLLCRITNYEDSNQSGFSALESATEKLSDIGEMIDYDRLFRYHCRTPEDRLAFALMLNYGSNLFSDQGVLKLAERCVVAGDRRAFHHVYSSNPDLIQDEFSIEIPWDLEGFDELDEYDRLVPAPEDE